MLVLIISAIFVNKSAGHYTVDFLENLTKIANSFKVVNIFSNNFIENISNF